ncbi:hypothetical protein CC79DRAFT_854063 [Sarocladium strictum]
MKLSSTLLALFLTQAMAIPTDKGPFQAPTIGNIVRDLPKDPEGSFALRDGKVTSYDADDNVLASRSLTAVEASVLSNIEKRNEQIDDDESAGVDLWPGGCSPPIACTKSSTCTGTCSNCVKIGFFPIRICSQ